MTSVFIDGQNFLYKAASVLIAEKRISDKQDLYKIDIRSIIESLLNEKDITVRYYGTKVRIFAQNDEILAKTTRIVDSQRRLRNTLASQEIIFVEAGKLKIRDGDVCKKCGNTDLHLQEKGVDVRIAIDMILDANNGIDHIALVSSDTDLLPPIRALRKSGVKVTYIGFSDKTTNALIQASSDLQIIRNKEIIDAFDRLNQQQLP